MARKSHLMTCPDVASSIGLELSHTLLRMDEASRPNAVTAVTIPARDRGEYCKKSKEPLVVVVVLNLNRPRDTIECVESVLKSEYDNLEVTVFDNGSIGDDVFQLRSRFGDSIRIMESTGNVGVAAAWNSVVKTVCLASNPEFFFFLNNDATIDSSTLYEILLFSETESAIGAVGPTILAYDPPHDFQYVRHEKIIHPVVDYNLSGCALLVRTDVFRAVGLFDEDYFVYAEEKDFLRRMKDSEWLAYYLPTRGKVYHRGAMTSSMLSGFEAFHRSKSELTFAAKNLDGFELAAFICRYFLKWLPRSILNGLDLPKEGERKSSLCYALGAVAGMTDFMTYRCSRNKRKSKQSLLLALRMT